jgi:thiamine biosynthesis lipoprotein
MPRILSRRLRIAAALVASAVLLASCARQEEHRAEFYLFGTVLEVVTWGATERQAGEAFARLQDMFNRMHRDWHPWEPGMLVDVNRAFSEGRSVTAGDDLIYLVERSQEIEKKSNGLFNPAIGALIDLWGFHTSEFPIIGPPPSADAIRQIIGQRPSSLDITIDGDRLQSAKPLVQLDFGGIAKGYAIDLACDLLREMGIENAIVNAGGDLRAFGSHGTRPWRVGIRKPGGGVVGGVESNGDEAVFTSGVYERFRQHEERRYPHILNPKTGWPVEHVSAVTVIAGEGLLADAGATALMVAGPTAWLPVARSLGLYKVMLIDASGQVYVTPEMDLRVEFIDGVEPVVVAW